ncbi:hypothetical protein CHLRE_16g690507v5 [Chlamydomonas reinhardtii]|uniref:Uncharacterized protein n=1 Tax=Chlamydomonas reinhardtii TaxID=3055 RepID=A0A2K3CU85_CHLRE|nr:uncharacterized protein CHLRE_16g690507v5 [Chlamydomonas reinhardtii]PNW71843.1 hypothetical protein CHLRE_16g690507v5 [Chlamydomonas reinhardtii]
MGAQRSSLTCQQALLARGRTGLARHVTNELSRWHFPRPQQRPHQAAPPAGHDWQLSQKPAAANGTRTVCK